MKLVFIVFTNPKIDNARATQIFDLLLKRQEYASLATATIEPRFLLDIRVPASEAQLQQRKQFIVHKHRYTMLHLRILNKI